MSARQQSFACASTNTPPLHVRCQSHVPISARSIRAYARTRTSYAPTAAGLPNSISNKHRAWACACSRAFQRHDNPSLGRVRPRRPWPGGSCGKIALKPRPPSLFPPFSSVRYGYCGKNANSGTLNPEIDESRLAIFTIGTFLKIFQKCCHI